MPRKNEIPASAGNPLSFVTRGGGDDVRTRSGITRSPERRGWSFDAKIMPLSRRGRTRDIRGIATRLDGAEGESCRENALVFHSRERRRVARDERGCAAVGDGDEILRECMRAGSRVCIYARLFHFYNRRTSFAARAETESARSRASLPRMEVAAS